MKGQGSPYVNWSLPGLVWKGFMPQPRSPLGSSFAILYPRHRDVSLRNRVARSLGFHPGQRFHRQCFNQKPLHPTCLHYYLPPVACKTLPGLHMAFVVRELPGRKPHTLPCNICAWDKLQVFITRAKLGTLQAQEIYRHDPGPSHRQEGHGGRMRGAAFEERPRRPKDKDRIAAIHFP